MPADPLRDIGLIGTGLIAPQVSERLLEHGVRIGSMDERLMRAVTHPDVDTAEGRGSGPGAGGGGRVMLCRWW